MSNSPSKLDHLAALDGLRGLAVLLVLMAHLPQLGHSLPAFVFKSFSNHLRAGYIGVDIFFVLSGFLITRILLHGKTHRFSLWRFYARRSLRIFPIYYLTVLAVWLWSHYDVKWAAVYLFNFYHAFHTTPHPLAHTWSLSVEEHFYILWPFLTYALPRPVGRLFSLAVIPLLSLAATICAVVMLPGEVAGNLVYMGTFSRMLSLSVGASVAFHEAYFRDASNRRVDVTAYLALVLGVLLIWLRDHVPEPIVASTWKPLFVWAGSAMASAGVVALGLRGSIPHISRWLCAEPLRWMGRISYGLYLYHFVIFFVLGISHFQTNQPVAPYWGLLGLALTFLVSAASFKWIEKPLLDLKPSFENAASPGPSARTITGSRRIIPEDWLSPLPLGEIYDPARPVEVDLGCGKGRFLLARAHRHPEVQFLGIDRMLRRIRKIDNKAQRLKLSNIRLLRLEGFYAVAYLLPPSSVSTYYIFFPDPWPKKKHHEHRLFNPKFIDALHRTLKPGGVVHAATDHLPYFEIIREALERDARFGTVAPFVPDEEERTDFERWYHGKTEIGRVSVRKV